MKSKKRFNILYNADKDIGFGVGYYIVYENYKGEPTFDCKYGTFDYSEEVEMVSVGIINKIYRLYNMGYVLDIYFSPRIEDLF